MTANVIQFTNHGRHKYAFHHIFDRVCDEHGIEHRLTRMRPSNASNTTAMITCADTSGFHRRLQLRPKAESTEETHTYEFIRKQRTSEPDQSIINPIHEMPRLNTLVGGPMNAAMFCRSARLHRRGYRDGLDTRKTVDPPTGREGGAKRRYPQAS